MLEDNIKVLRVIGKVYRLIVFKMLGVNMPSLWNFNERPVIDFGVRIAKPKNIFWGGKIHLYPYCYLKSCPGTIHIGDKSSVGEFSYINSMESVWIGNNVLIAPSCHITDANHDISGVSPISENKRISKPVIIKSNSWIGANVKILSGVTVGKGAVVGAGSVINKDLPDYSIAVGIPGRVIGYRKNKDINRSFCEMVKTSK
ncbi:acyltransferase [Desulfosarcina ovata]|uniref:Acetyltransferase n=1 Tax=Desulfosarcina ovata subsp. ovata TaxID=2752305 RepID=A0A5K8A5J7_9BACT|nr:acyltransferase [Desulfosarcina ovata]BBO87658.1 hypothetical protein DSCOOX_08380 [Desulfosarcina ovata subsp. ovata]